jgi:hypothetical protein
VHVHDVAVTGVAPSRTVVGQGYSDKVNVTVVNYGTYTETFNVAVYANTTTIASQNVTLLSGDSATITVAWNTAGFAYGNYILSANIALAPGETNYWTGPFIDGTVKVTIPSDVAITSATSSKTVVGQGYSDEVNVTVVNYGTNTETFNVTVYANTTAIATQTVILVSGAFTTITLTWNTAGFAYGNYIISASVTLAKGETNTWVGPFTYGTVKVTIPGDINGDGVVNIFDLGIITGNWQQTVPPAPANADILGVGIINLLDLGMVTGHWMMQI